MDKLIILFCEPCGNDRDSWCRVHTVRMVNGSPREFTSELSWPCAYRIVPKMLRNNGAMNPDCLSGEHVEHAYDIPGLWHRRIVKVA